MSSPDPRSPRPSPAPSPGAPPTEAPQTRAYRLSESPLWETQHRFYREQSLQAFRSAVVPHEITSNPAMAHAYATVVFGFFRDAYSDARRKASSAGSGASPAPLERHYIVELGSGTGRFAFQFCRAFFDLLARSAFPDLPVCYVMTDFNEGTIAFWRAHESLRPFVQRGQLDFAVFDAESTDALALECSGVRLSRDQTPGLPPLTVIANYVLDSLKNDAFTFIDGNTYECLVSVGDEVPPVPFGSADYFEHLKIRFDRRPAPANYYPDPVWNEILARYAALLEDSTVLFPCSAVRCIERLAALTRGPLMLLSGDKGFAHEQLLSDRGDPYIASHGSFSVTVNYHAISAWVRARGGVALNQPQAVTSLHVGAYLLGQSADDFVDTRLAFHEAFGVAPPEDLRNVRRAVAENYQILDPEDFLSLVRLARNDPSVLFDCLPALLERIDDFDAALAHDLRALVRRAWDNYYSIGESDDLPFGFGLILYHAEYPTAAAEMFRHSLRLHGPHPAVYWNLARCAESLGEDEEADGFLAQARALDPAYAPTTKLARKLPIEKAP